MKRIEFLVAGEPVVKSRPRVLRSGRTYTPARTREYEARVKEAAARAFPGGPISVPCRVSLCFVMPTRRRADIDNLAKAFLDGAIGAAYLDDCQVTWMQVEKTYNKGMGCTAAVVEWEDYENP
jgi:Holliday junction resolvase RusA-like endonuclease